MDDGILNRAPKRDLKEEDKPSVGQPIVKIVKAGETVSSPEVAELKQKLRESQEALHAEKKRANMLKARVDLSSAMEGARTAVNLKIMEEKNSLETERAEIEEKHYTSLLKNDELKAKMDKMGEDHQKRFATVSSLLEYTKRKADSTEKNLVLENDALKAKMAKLVEDRKKSALENEALKSKMAEMIKEHQKRIDDVTHQMKEDHEERIGELLAINAQLEDKVTAAESVERVKGVELQLKADPINILQLCHPDSNESTSYFTASRKINEALHKFTEYSSGKGRRSGDGFLGVLLQHKSLTLECGACQHDYTKSGIIQHFLSEKHSKKVHDLYGAVSTAALEYWLDLLQPKPAVIAMLQQKKLLKEAAAAAQNALKQPHAPPPTQQQPTAASASAVGVAAAPTQQPTLKLQPKSEDDVGSSNRAGSSMQPLVAAPAASPESSEASGLGCTSSSSSASSSVTSSGSSYDDSDDNEEEEASEASKETVEEKKVDG